MFRKFTVKPNPKAPWTQKLRLFDGGAKSFSATFTPGVNVIVGPNGSGKSVLIRALEAFAMQEDGRVSVTPRDGADFKRISTDTYRRAARGVIMDAEWNGTLTWNITPQKLFNLGNHTDAIFEFLESSDEKMQGDGFSMAIFGRNKFSGGEKTSANFAFMFKSFIRMASSSIIFSDEKINSVNEVWGEAFKQFNKIVSEAQESAKRDGLTEKATMLLDEPEMSLDWTRRIELADGLGAPAEAGKQFKFQLIAATHCPALLEIAENVIETVPGYAATMNGFYDWLAKKKQQKQQQKQRMEKQP